MRWFSKRPASSQPPAAISGGSGDGATVVLVVDDDLAVQRLLRLVLQDEGFRVVKATSGFQALAEAGAVPPDAIVLDLELPGMKGREIFQRLREQGVDAPVLILSAYGARDAQRDLNAQAYMDKPFLADRLADKLRKLVRKY